MADFGNTLIKGSLRVIGDAYLHGLYASSLNFNDEQHRITVEDGSSLTRYTGSTISLPNSSGKGIAILTDEGVDYGLMYVGSDGALIANSGDTGYVLRVNDKDTGTDILQVCQTSGTSAFNSNLNVNGVLDATSIKESNVSLTDKYLQLSGGAMAGTITGAQNGKGIVFQSTDTNSSGWAEGIYILDTAHNNYSTLTLGNSDKSDLLALVHNGVSNRYYFDVKVDGTNHTLNIPIRDGTIAVHGDAQPANGGTANYLSQIGYNSDNDGMPSSGNTFGVYYGTPSGLSNDGHILSFNWSTGGVGAAYGAQIFIDTDPTYTMALRQRNSSGQWNDWVGIITANNIGSQSVNYATSAGSAGTLGVYSQSDFLHIDGGTMTGTPYINMPASAATISDSQPFGITYGRIQGYGPIVIAADTDGSTSEHVIITAGYGVANATAANGLAIGYNTLKWKGTDVALTSNFTGTTSGGNWTSITINGTTANIPQGGSSGVSSFGGVTGAISLGSGFSMSGNTLQGAFLSTASGGTVNGDVTVTGGSNSVTFTIGGNYSKGTLRIWDGADGSYIDLKADTTFNNQTLFIPNEGDEHTIATQEWVSDRGYITSSGSCSYASNSGYTNLLRYLDTRDIAVSVADAVGYDGIKIEFKNKSTSGIPSSGTWTALITLDGYSDSSGGYPSQLGFSMSDLGEDRHLYMRSPSDSSTWGNWKTIAFTSDIPSSLPANGGTADSISNLNLIRNSNSLSSGGWNALGGLYQGSVIAISYANSSPANWNSSAYSASLVFGCNDTKGLVDCAYSVPRVTFGGSSIGGSTADNPTWYFKLEGSSATTYNLDNMITTSNIGNQNVNYANSAGAVAWADVSGHPTDLGDFGNTAGYIKGIDYTMVINALGYTPPSTDHTYNFAGVYFESGNSGNGNHDCNAVTYNSHDYYTSNGPSGLGESTSDGALYSQAYSSDWVGQIAQDYRNGRLFVRGKNSGTWQAWKRIAQYEEIPSGVSLWNGGSTTWYTTNNVSCAADGNGDGEWSFDCDGTNSSNVWQVWSSRNSNTILQCYPYDNHVAIPNGYLSVGGAIYEGGTSLADKYLGKTAKAADSDLLDGHNSSYFINTSNISNQDVRKSENVGYIDARADASVLPIRDNATGRLKIVLCSSEPAAKYDGYIYLILS